MNKKPALIAALVGVGLVVVMVVGLITPRASQVKSTEKKVDEAQMQQTTLQSQLEQLQAAAKDAPKDRKRLANLEAQIPPQADLAGLIRTLNDTADKAGVDFATIAPAAPVPSGQFTVIPIDITVNGTFFAVDHYLFILENLKRVSKVITLTVTPVDQTISPPQLQVALTANFYTTDTSAGPGSIPSSVQQQSPAVGPTPVATPTEG
jgi:Tfp pilus assembly protein PilO